MEITTFSIAFALFLLMDPIGNIPIYLSVLSEIPRKRRQMIIIREKIIALIIILIFSYFGNGFFHFLGITHEAMYLAGGVVLFVMAIKMIFPEGGSLQDALYSEGEPLVFPLAIPLVAGPSVLAAVMIYSSQTDSFWIMLYAIFIAWLVSTIILLGSSFLQTWLGSRGIKALERLMGLVLMLIAINMFVQGWKELCITGKSLSLLKGRSLLVGKKPAKEPALKMPYFLP